MSAQMWFQFSPLLGESWMLIANMPWPHWTVSKTQKTEGKRTCLLFFHKQLQIDQNNVLGCRHTGNVRTIKPSPLLHCSSDEGQPCRQTNTQLLWFKGKFCITRRVLTPMNADRPDQTRPDQARQRLFSPETIQQHEAPFTRSTEHEPPAPIKKRHNKSLFKVLWKEITDGERKQDQVGKRQRKQFGCLKQIHYGHYVLYHRTIFQRFKDQ